MADQGNHRVLRYNIYSKKGVVVAGYSGMGNSLSQLNRPMSICIDPDDNLYIADTLNHRILKY